MAIADRREREKSHRRKAIADAAEKLFFEKGYDNVSMNDIAEEVELNRATIYQYFDNKEALCFEVVLRGVHVLNQLVKNHVKNATPTHKIMAFGTAYFTFFNSYPQYVHVYNLFQSGRFDISGLRCPAWNDVHKILKLQEEIFDTLHSTLKINRRTLISDSVDPFYATILIVSTMDKMLNPSPFLEKEFEKMDVNEYENFNVIFLNFINHLLKKE